MRKLALLFILLATLPLGAQDLASYKRAVKELSSSKYQGRGYARGGANKAGKYLQKAFTKAGASEVILHTCGLFTVDQCHLECNTKKPACLPLTQKSL